MEKLLFNNLPIIGLSDQQIKVNHINVNDFKYIIHGHKRWQKDIYCNSFDNLSDEDRQEIAHRYISNHYFSLDNCVVNYILNKSWEDQETPFSWDDLTNHHRFGQIEIGGYWKEVTEEERDELIEKFDHLVDRWYDYKEDVLQARIDDLEEEQLDADDQEYDRLEALIKPLQSRYEEAGKKHDDLDSTLDNLRALECDEEHEIYQWFKVDRDTACSLDELGEPILNGDYWGRGACGQSITLDHCIQKIAFNHLSTRL